LKNNQICFAGMTHLGLNMAVAYSEKNISIVCFDKDQKKINKIKNGHLPFSEPKLNNLLKKNNKRILFTSNLADLKKCGIVFIAEDIKTDAYGISDLKPIKKLVNLVTKNVNPKATLVMLSQIPPKFTRKHFPKKRKVFYQVETLIFGQAILRALKPERFIIGCLKPDEKLPMQYERLLLKFRCPILRMNYESAEICKTAINMYLASSITFANTLAEITEKIGGDWEEIKEAMKLDKRIGQYSYINPGLGIAGGNIERDLMTLMKISRKLKIKPGLIDVCLKDSTYRKCWTLEKVKKIGLDSKKTKIAILGLAYKPGTSSIKNSPSLELIKKLGNVSLHLHDPLVENYPKKRNLRFFPTPLAAIENCDMMIIMTPWKEYKKLSLRKVCRLLRKPNIIDPYRALNLKTISRKTINYHAIGIKC
jgi:UDPglucose 6-dehydrogenase|tara:strand:- start:581 stop:1846 length:1266 start_codon:yes stop_codon:yes gene_type:complete